MAKRKAFTLPEVLFAAGILSMVVGISVSILLLINTLLYDGQIEKTNRENLSSTAYYITREIQSADAILIVDDKVLKIKPRGASGYILEYRIENYYPVGYLSFKNKRLLDLHYDNSRFSHHGNLIEIVMEIYPNNIEVNQNSKNIQLDVFPRNTSILIETVE